MEGPVPHALSVYRATTTAEGSAELGARETATEMLGATSNGYGGRAGGCSPAHAPKTGGRWREGMGQGGDGGDAMKIFQLDAVIPPLHLDPQDAAGGSSIVV